jgi:tetratricopeptide (TPR) repeat protein
LASYALLQFQQGRWQNASDTMEKALTLSGRNDLNYDFMVVLYAGILMRTNRPEKAREYLDRETKESPMYGPGWSTRAELNAQSGNYAAGRADAQIGLLLNPRDPQALHVMAWLNKTAPVATQR